MYWFNSQTTCNQTDVNVIKTKPLCKVHCIVKGVHSLIGHHIRASVGKRWIFAAWIFVFRYIPFALGVSKRKMNIYISSIEQIISSIAQIMKVLLSKEDTTDECFVYCSTIGVCIIAWTFQETG